MKTVLVGLAAFCIVCGSSARAADDLAAQVAAFRAECAALAAAADKADTIAVPGRDGWLFFSAELRHIKAGAFWGEAAAKVSAAPKPEFADPLPAIIDFKQQLDKLGIELLVVPVPPKAVIYPDMLTDKLKVDAARPQRLDPQHVEFYKLLAEKGVAVLDLVPEFLARRNDKDGLLYCKHDTHWSGRGCVLAAQLIAKAVADRPWLKDIPKRQRAAEGDAAPAVKPEAAGEPAAAGKLACETKLVEIAGDLGRELHADSPPNEKLPLRFIGTKKDAALEPIAPDKDSPVLLLSDSHGLVFHSGDDMYARGAGLADQLAFELGFPVDLMAVRGSAATLVRVNLYRRGQTEPGFLARKKLVIWCVAAREFTESETGWRKIPVVKPAED